jgi:taurine transport system substrate-binding protein
MRKRLLTVAFLCAMAIMLFNGGQEESLKPMRVAVPFSVSSIPVLELDGRTIAGRKVEVVIFQDHSLTLAEFLRGDIDVLMTGFTQGMAAFIANRDVRHLATLVWGVSSIMARDPAVKKLEDLVGKKLAVPFAKSPLDLQTRAILASQGLLDKIQIEYAPPQQAAALLLAGNLDAAALPEPLPTQLEMGGQVHRLARYQDLWARTTGGEGRSPQVSLFVREPFARANGAFVAELIGAVDAAVTAVSADPEKAAANHAAAFKLNPAVVKTGLSQTLLAVPGSAKARALIDDYLRRIGLPPADPAFFYGK